MYKIGIIGLGYVGLPLAVEFTKAGYEVVGIDIDRLKLDRLATGIDDTSELDQHDLLQISRIMLTDDAVHLRGCRFIIVTVPTPIDSACNPDIGALMSATVSVAKNLDRGTTVIYESTVYPGMTMGVCKPIIEELSGQRLNIDFFLGYSPERVNPGSKDRKLRDITKIVAGSSHEVAQDLAKLYLAIIDAGVHVAESIEIAEAAKIIENTQRDVNIALMNEFSLILSRLNLSTSKVLEAAGTKWNFLPFVPGLVGGHCIGVDPYYLSYRAKELGLHTPLINAARCINDGMVEYVRDSILAKLIHKRLDLNNTRILLVGITFKENCPDTRNSKSLELLELLSKSGLKPSVYDPIAVREGMVDIDFIEDSELFSMTQNVVVIVSVLHDQDIDRFNDYTRRIDRDSSLLFDLKSKLKSVQSDFSL